MRATIALNSGCSPIPNGTRMGWKTHINLNTSPITNHLNLSVHFVRYSPAYQGELALDQARLLGSFLLNFGSLHITPGRTCCKSSTRENFPWHHDISSWGPLGRQASWVKRCRNRVSVSLWARTQGQLITSDQSQAAGCVDEQWVEPLAESLELWVSKALWASKLNVVFFKPFTRPKKGLEATKKSSNHQTWNIHLRKTANPFSP